MTDLSTEREKQELFATNYITANAQNFNHSDIYIIKDNLEELPVNRQTAVQALPLKSPIIALILSLFLGVLGIDRFYIGNIGLGILKLITVGFFGIWTIVDWFLIMNASKNVNYKKVMSTI